MLYLLQNDDVKKEIKEGMKTIVHMVYNEIYLYVWFISIYSIFLMSITLANTFVLLKLWSRGGGVLFIEPATHFTSPATQFTCPTTPPAL